MNEKKIGKYAAGVNESLMDPDYPVFNMRNLGTLLDKYNDHPSVKTKKTFSRRNRINLFPNMEYSFSLAYGRL
jgi:hypothetical protein